MSESLRASNVMSGEPRWVKYHVNGLFLPSSVMRVKKAIMLLDDVLIKDVVVNVEDGLVCVEVFSEDKNFEWRIRDVIVSLGFCVKCESAVVSNFLIEGMSCASCASRIESHLRSQPGVFSVSINYATMSGQVEHDEKVITASQLMEEIEKMGYTVTLRANLLNTAHPFYGTDTGDIRLMIGGMSCASCASRIESCVRRLDDVEDCVVNFSTATCTVYLKPGGDIEHVKDKIVSMGFTVCVISGYVETGGVSETKNALERAREIEEHKKGFIGSALLAAPMGVVMLLMTTTNVLDDIFLMELVEGLQFLLTTPIIFYFGSGFFTRAWQNLLHNSFTMDTLVAIGTGASYLYSVVAYSVTLLTQHHMMTYFDTAGMLLAFMLLGRYLEARAKRSTSDALIELMNLVPPVSIIVTPQGDLTVPSTSVKKGMRVRVLAGDRIPVDGTVVEGMTDVDEQMVTGEAVLKTIKPGSKVIGGTTNVTSMFVMQADRIGEETMLSQILRVVQDAQNSKPAIQRIADQVAAYFVPIVIIFSISVFLIWLLIGVFDVYPSEWRRHQESILVFALDFFISTIVAACPCALGLATPTAIMVGTGVGAKNGILVKSGAILEVVHRSRCIVFDKTGTITNGKLRVVFNKCYGEDVSTVINAVGSVEQQSNHPVAKAVAASIIPVNQVPMYEVLNSKTLSGLGVEAFVRSIENGAEFEVHVGSLAMMQQININISLEVQRTVQRQADLGRTIVIGAVNGIARLVVALSDEPKDEALGVVRYLQNQHFRVLLVTGDNKNAAAHVASAVGIHPGNVFSEVLPTTKADIVKQLQEEGNHVIFIGDGINDSPALAQADVGVALGAGTEIAIEAADVVLLNNNLVDLLNLQALSVVTVRRVYGNFIWAFGYNIVMLPLASGMLYPLLQIKLPPIIAGSAMILSSLSVLLSSLSIRCFKPFLQDRFTITF
ncbi:putative copper-transporting ATPase-like protein [Trypanosoma theileri]|uniref:Putative copper-transporting ATPase-like protein n=1 Tax=Trypanosoma theileri TaxID=67003 RepID=A0A1X0P531_9TRYP|nr:putative copper-transporting ATPase-like protein [Trypanosoma theileri]ORC91649.1 putative copper-transporting ATPase-like protein [Trypanosoma theileri]